MTVAQQETIFEYVSDGVEVNYYYPTRYDNADQLEVFIDTVLLPDTEWTATPGDENGGTVTLNVAAALGAIVRVQRAVPIEREFDYIQGGQLNAETLDLDVDRVVMMVQDLADRSFVTIPGGDFDAGGNKIINVGDPTEDTDAANKKYVDDQDALKADLVHSHLMADITDNALGALSDVDTTGVVLGQTITFNGSVWVPSTSSASDHLALLNIGINTHDQIDTHINDGDIHYEQGDIQIEESQISDLQPYLLDITGEPIADLSNVSAAPPGLNQVLKWDGAQWIPSDDETGGGFTFPDAPSDGFTYARNNALWVQTIDDISQEVLGDLLNVDTTGLVAGDVLTFIGGIWTAQTPASGVTTFTALLDTPPDYTGEAGKVVVVNNAEDGLEYVAGAGGAVNSVFGRQGTIVAEEADYDLTLLGDVTITTPLDRQTLIYVGGEWVNTYPLLGDNIDVLIPSPTNGQVLTYDGADWVALDNPGDVQSVFGRTGVVTAQEGDYIFGQLGDVTISAPSDGQLVYYNGGTTSFTHGNAAGLGLLANVDPSIASGLLDAMGLRWVDANGQWEKSADFATASQGALADTALQNINGESINELLDVNINGVVTNDVLVWNGTNFIVSHNINDLGTTVDDLWSASQIQAQISGDISGKADKIIPAFASNLAGLNASGNLTDSGYGPLEFAPVVHTHVETDVLDLDRTRWKGPWLEIEYYKNDIVTDAGWLMVANDTTSDRAAPQPLGDPSWGIENVLWTTPDAAATVKSGAIYTFTHGVWLERLRVWAPDIDADITYRVVLVNITNPAVPLAIVLSSPVLIEDGWAIVAANQEVVRPGEVIRIYLEALNSGASTNISGGWTYDGTSNNGAPGDQGWNRRNQHNIVRIDFTDLDSVNRETELMSMTVGTEIDFVQSSNNNNYYSYTVTGAPINYVTYCEVVVNLIDSGNDIGLLETCSVSIDVPIPANTDYVESENYWSGNQPSFATVAGWLEIDGVEQPGKTDSAFGIDLYVQPAQISPNWEFMAGGSGSGGTGSGGDGVGEAPEDGTPYSRQDKLWTQAPVKSITDAHIADATIHFTEASISINESQVTDLQPYLLDISTQTLGQLSNVAENTIAGVHFLTTDGTVANWSGEYFSLNDSISGAGILWTSEKINQELDLKSDITYVDGQLALKSDTVHTHNGDDIFTQNTIIAGGGLVLGPADAGKMILMSSTNPETVTVETNALSAFAVGTEIHIEQQGSGQVSIVAEPGVSIQSAESMNLRKQHSVVTLLNIGVDQWLLFGDLEPSVTLLGVQSNVLAGHAGEVIVINGSEDGFDLVDFPAVNVYGTDYNYAQDETESTTTATTPQSKLTMLVNIAEDGDYEVEVNYLWDMNSSSQSFMAQIVESGNVLSSVSMEPKDGTNYETGFYKTVRSLTAGAYTYGIDYWSESGAQVAIKNVLITFKRVA